MACITASPQINGAGEGIELPTRGSSIPDQGCGVVPQFLDNPGVLPGNVAFITLPIAERKTQKTACFQPFCAGLLIRWSTVRIRHDPPPNRDCAGKIAVSPCFRAGLSPSGLKWSPLLRCRNARPSPRAAHSLFSDRSIARRTSSDPKNVIGRGCSPIHAQPCIRRTGCS